MRYLLVTYVKKANGQIDEQVGASRNLKERDIRTCNVILDFKEQKVERAYINGKQIDTDWDRMQQYYNQIYPALIGDLRRDNGLPELSSEEPQTDTTSEPQ